MLPRRAMRIRSLWFLPLLVASTLGACSTPSASSGADSSSPCDTPAGSTTAVVSNGLYTYGLAVDDTYVYAATPQGVWRVVRTGGTPTQLSGTSEADAIAIDSGHVYWTGNYTIGSGPKPMSGAGLFSAPIGGGAATMLSANAWSMQIAVDDTNVYGSIGPWSVPIGGGTETTLAQGGASFATAAIALYDSDIYVAAAPPGPPAIVSIPKTGGAFTVLVPNRAHPTAIAVDATGIYWGEYSYLDQTGGIFRAALDGTGVALLSSDDDVSGIAIDADNVYWSAQHTNSILSVPKSGGAVVTLADGLDGPAGVVQYGGNVYWAEQPFLDASLGPAGDAGGSPTVMTACK